LNRPAARAGNKLPLHLQRAVGLRTTDPSRHVGRRTKQVVISITVDA